MKQANNIQHGNNFDALDMHILINKISSVVLELETIKNPNKHIQTTTERGLNWTGQNHLRTSYVNIGKLTRKDNLSFYSREIK